VFLKLKCHRKQKQKQKKWKIQLTLQNLTTFLIMTLIFKILQYGSIKFSKFSILNVIHPLVISNVLSSLTENSSRALHMYFFVQKFQNYLLYMC
jgi:hypothetical protein